MSVDRVAQVSAVLRFRRGTALWLLAAALPLAAIPAQAAAPPKAALPEPAVGPTVPVTPLPPEYDLPLADISGTAGVILAGGRFWGMQAVFQHLKGVTDVVAGYTGGLKETANHADVSKDGTGHAESVLIEYDPSKISIGTLLQVYFFVAHDPTQLNRQGPDVGSQYRSSIFTDDADFKRVAIAYMNQIDALKGFPHPVATKTRKTFPFFRAEGYHQNYVQNHPNERYVRQYDLPRIKRLKEAFPKLWRDPPLRYVPIENRRSKLIPPPDFDNAQ